MNKSTVDELVQLVESARALRKKQKDDYQEICSSEAEDYLPFLLKIFTHVAKEGSVSYKIHVCDLNSSVALIDLNISRFIFSRNFAQNICVIRSKHVIAVCQKLRDLGFSVNRFNMNAGTEAINVVWQTSQYSV